MSSAYCAIDVPSSKEYWAGRPQRFAAISNGRSLTMRLITELDVATSHLGEMEREIDAGPESPSRRNAMLKAVSLPSRAAVMRDLATACRAWVGLERQAFSIVEEKEPPPPVSESCTAEELRGGVIGVLCDRCAVVERVLGRPSTALSLKALTACKTGVKAFGRSWHALQGCDRCGQF